MLPISGSNVPHTSNASTRSLLTQVEAIHEQVNGEGQSIVQASENCVVSNQLYGESHTVTTNFFLTASDSNTKLIFEKLNGHAEASRYKPLAQLGTQIEELRTAYLNVLEEVDEIRDGLALYIPSEGQETADSKTPFTLIDKVREFLSSKKKVLLLLGEAGSGKSTFNRHLTRMLWDEHQQSSTTPIPVFIALAEHTSTCEDLIESYLLEQEFSPEAIAMLRKEKRLVFILDGFDEIQDRTQAFYTQNKLDHWKNAQVIISSRPEYLGGNYRSQFQKRGQTSALQEYWLSPISDDWIAAYIQKYIQHTQRTEWDLKWYQDVLNNLPTLKEAIRRPFLLRMALDLLPDLAESGSEPMTRIALYDAFISSWWNRSEERLQHIKLTDEEKNARNKLGQHLAAEGLRASHEMAIALAQKGLIQASYEPEKGKVVPEAWRNYFDKKDAEKRLLLFNAPLIHQGQHYRFIHKSIQDYLVARVLWEELDAHDKIEASSWLNTLNIVNDPAVLQFLAERVRQQPKLETQLLSVVERSKKEDEFEVGAANALTILVKGGVQLNNKDFSGIRVQGADLSYGVFDHTQFEGADLREVKGYGAWLRGVNLNGADLKGMKLGERPTLKVDRWVQACCYSPDGHWLAVAWNYYINLYETKDLQKVHTYAGHEHLVNSVAFSSDSQWLASGSTDHTMKLWNVSGARSLAHTYAGHEWGVNSVVFSADGQWLASGSYDKTVKLWHVSGNRSLAHTYAGHEDKVNSVALSEDGQWLASGSNDRTVKLWNVTGARSLAHTYAGHEGYLNSVAFSADSQWLASGSDDHTVKLWNVMGARSLAHTYAGHRRYISSVAFSDDGKWLASGSGDNTVKLWNVFGARSLAHTYAGHWGQVSSVAFSVDGQWLASGSHDKTVKLWSVFGARSLAYTYAGHVGVVSSIAFSADGQWLASGSHDKTVKLWNVFGACSLAYTYAGHEDAVLSIALSADGQWLASGDGNPIRDGDHTVKLWNVFGARSLAHTYAGHEEGVNSVAFSADGQWLASGGSDYTVKLWNIFGARSLAHTYTGHEEGVNSVAFSADGQWLASGSSDHTVKLWNVFGDRSLTHTYAGHKKEVWCIAFSSDGRWLASGSQDKTVKLWHVMGTRSLAHTCAGYEGGVNSVAFSADSQWLASGSEFRTVRLWSVLTGDCQAALQSFVGCVGAIAWQPTHDGAAILSTAGTDGAIRLWRVSYESGQIGKIILDWTSQQDALSATGALIENARNLNPQNRALLMQRGAGRVEVGESATAFFEEDTDVLSSELDEFSERSYDEEDSVESDMNRVFETENLFQNTVEVESEEPGEMPWDGEGSVEEKMSDAESSLKKRTYSSILASSEINRKRGRGDGDFV